ncbi:MAG: hypothetical protein J7M30_06450, partial [Deltaproteobacteria bacterium]|nr:hypothetical protein [Deltaproteobacteria bacterium]
GEGQLTVVSDYSGIFSTVRLRGKRNGKGRSWICIQKEEKKKSDKTSERTDGFHGVPQPKLS